MFRTPPHFVRFPAALSVSRRLHLLQLLVCVLFGTVLQEQQRGPEAEAVYRSDLGLDGKLSRACQHPGNVWSLHGLHECLRHRGEKVESAQVKLQLDKAMARAEIPIRIALGRGGQGDQGADQ